MGINCATSLVNFIIVCMSRPFHEKQNKLARFSI